MNADEWWAYSIYQDNFFIDGLFEDGEPIMEFVEEEETGRSTLHVSCQNECMCIKNLDHIEKKTGNKGDSTHIGFFRQDKLHGMCKRVDHTTYERVKLDAMSANPAERRAKLGVPAVSPEKEWSGENFALNINGRRAFQHIPVLMSRNAQNILEGVFSIS